MTIEQACRLDSLHFLVLLQWSMEIITISTQAFFFSKGNIESMDILSFLDMNTVHLQWSTKVLCYLLPLYVPLKTAYRKVLAKNLERVFEHLSLQSVNILNDGQQIVYSWSQMDGWGSEDSALLCIVRNANKHKSRNIVCGWESVCTSTYFNELERISAKYDMCSANILIFIISTSS